jgi:glycosyltransferase involved in cell wall biosynthesis
VNASAFFILMETAILKYIKRQGLHLSASLGSALREGLFVVIPAYNELHSLPQCISSLLNAEAVNRGVNVVVVVNHAANDLPDVKAASFDLAQWCRGLADSVNRSDFRILVLEAYDLDPKLKGAGLARKIGMDQALVCCVENGVEDGIIVSLDADTIVEQNYFVAIESFFAAGKHTACSIYFEHQTEVGSEFAFRSEAIALYELHLRYYRHALRASGFPFAIHTVGSAMACTVSAYAKAGGMVQKQAGEDFYFLHKLIRQGRFGELNSTTVYPSSRASTRVVFGTGATVHKMEQEGVLAYPSYNFQAFADLQVLFSNIALFYGVDESQFNEVIVKLPGRVRSFLVNHSFYQLISPISGHCASVSVFEKRFFEVFNAFMVIKYLNFTHENFLAKPDVLDAAVMLLENNGLIDDPFVDVFGLLNTYRQLDKQSVSVCLSNVH